mmetsp:Transcript_124911/g.243169  ORF Transcript_124911/g.243169 Transcript_124911/m.243169 type:complete len:482 (+) Transcript_124911:44-1489(+)
MLPASLSAKWVPRDFVEATATGGSVTLVAYVVMLVLFVLEMRSFLDSRVVSTLSLSDANGPHFRINLDIDMFDIECRNLRVVMLDDLDRSPIRLISKNYGLTTLDSVGQRKRSHSTKVGPDTDEDEDEIRHKQTMQKLEATDGRKELDSDWDSSHDGFKHQSWEHVLEYHDFTLINFFAGWCSHCRKFAPMWEDIAAQIQGNKFQDADGRERAVKPMKVNCVDFGDLCKQQGIDAFPTIRLYRRDQNFTRFNGKRSLDGIVSWVRDTAAQSFGWKKHHEELEDGCNIKGFVIVPRVPGHIELMAGVGDQDLEPTTTNVSHHVTHFSFEDPMSRFPRRENTPNFQWGLEYAMKELVYQSPLDGRSFVTDSFHQAFDHHMMVVSAIAPNGMNTYQFSSRDRTSRLNASTVPQARFFFEIDPFSILYQTQGKKWYDFVTMMLSILGGLFVLMRLFTRLSLSTASTLQRSSGKGATSAASRGLLT